MADNAGTRAKFDRLSEAFGYVVHALPIHPERAPFTVIDHLRGIAHTVVFTPPAVRPGGPGRVYVIDDERALKIGYTTNPVQRRLGQLQSGNPNKLRVVVTIESVDDDVEARLHHELRSLNISGGEWFEREGLLDRVNEHGSWSALVTAVLGEDDWEVLSGGLPRPAVAGSDDTWRYG